MKTCIAYLAVALVAIFAAQLFVPGLVLWQRIGCAIVAITVVRIVYDLAMTLYVLFRGYGLWIR